MNLPHYTKPAIGGAVGGAVLAMVIGFMWGGWVTAGRAHELANTSTEAAIRQAFTPLCVANAADQPEQRAALAAESSWKRDDFVIDAGWVDNVNETYRSGVADACADAVIAAM